MSSHGVTCTEGTEDADGYSDCAGALSNAGCGHQLPDYSRGAAPIRHHIRPAASSMPRWGGEEFFSLY